MPLIYKAIQSAIATKEGEKLYYPRLIKMGNVVDTQKISEMIAEKSSLTPGDVHNVVRNLMSVMREQLLNSRTVRLDGLGTFTMIARAGGRGVKTEKEMNSSQIKGLRCQFTPEYHRNGGVTTRSMTQGAEFISLAELAKSFKADLNENSGGSGEGGNPDDEFIDPTA